MVANASMATESQASSSTEEGDPLAADRSGQTLPAPEPGAAAEAPEAQAGVPARADQPAGLPPAGVDQAVGDPAASVDHDASRRAFFRQFGREAVTTLGQVAGMAGMVNRASGSAAASLLGLGDLTAPRRPQPPIRSGDWSATLGLKSPPPPAPDGVFRSAYRVSADELVLLDQRGIPEKLEELVARRGSDVAYYLRVGACRGGALMAQVAAYGLALTAAERATQSSLSRGAELRRTQRALVGARPSSRLLARVMERMESLRTGLGEAADGSAVAAALRAEADAIATEFQLGNAAIASALAELLGEPPGESPDELRGRAISVLLHGDSGALGGGLVGTGITALGQLRDAGRRLRVYVTETRPFMDGARLASWELRQAGIEHKVIPDSAAAWLFAREAVDAVVIAAEWVAANGDSGAVIGSRAIAQQAAAAVDDPGRARPRVIVCGLSAAIDPGTPDGRSIPEERGSARDLAAYLTGVPMRASDVLVPASDVIPAVAIAALVTERGVLEPPSAEAIASLLDGAVAGPA